VWLIAPAGTQEARAPAARYSRMRLLVANSLPGGGTLVVTIVQED